MKPSYSFRRPEKSPELLSLLRQRRQEQNRDQRKNLSRQIQRVARREFRAWRSLWANHLLDQYRNIKFLQRINTDPIQRKSCPIEDHQFANYLEELYDDVDTEAIGINWYLLS